MKQLIFLVFFISIVSCSTTKDRFYTDKKTIALDKVVDGTYKFVNQLKAFQDKTSDLWITAEYLRIKESDGSYAKKGQKIFNTIRHINDYTGYTNLYEDLFFKEVEKYLNSIDKGARFSEIWTAFISIAERQFGTVLSKSDYTAGFGIRQTGYHKLKKLDTIVVPYFDKHYYFFKQSYFYTTPDLTPLFNNFKAIYEECYTLTMEDYDNNEITVQGYLKNNLAKVQESKYKNCNISIEQFQEQLKQNWKYQIPEKETFIAIQQAIFKTIGQADTSFLVIAKRLEQLTFPTYTKVRESQIKQPTELEEVLMQIDFYDLLEESIDQQSKFYLTTNDDFGLFKLDIDFFITQNFLATLSEELKALNTLGQVIDKDKSIIFVDAWFRQMEKFPTYSFFEKANKDFKEAWQKESSSTFNQFKLILEKSIKDNLYYDDLVPIAFELYKLMPKVTVEEKDKDIISLIRKKYVYSLKEPLCIGHCFPNAKPLALMLKTIIE